VPAKVGRSYLLQITNFSAGGPDTVFTIGSIAGKDEIGGDALKVEFDVAKSIEPEPNRCRIRIYNLSETGRNRVSGLIKRKIGRLSPSDRVKLFAGGQAQTAPEITYSNLGVAYIKLYAGYGADRGLIFEGSSERIRHYRPDNTTWVTELDSGDGRKAIEEATINKSYAPGTPGSIVLKDLVHHLGATVSPLELSKLAGTTMIYGLSAVGQIKPLLEELLWAVDQDADDGLAKWSIQDGEFVIYNDNRTLPQPPVEIGPGTGLVGSPEPMDEGVIRAQALLDYRIRPGAVVTLRSSQFTGGYRCNGVTHSGDSYGEGAWVSSMELHDLSVLTGGGL
jgi:hypothetical protein